MASERLPLLAAGTSEVDTNLSYGSDGYWTDSGTARGHRRNKRPSFGKLSIIESNGSKEQNGGVKMGRTLGLGTAIMLMISCCCGTGIFVSPVGVTQSVGSVGLTLCVWAFCGVFSMVLALCYAELGTAIPVAGGDYAYIQTLLGPFPAFLCLWMLVVLVAPAAATIMGLAVAEYLAGMLDLDCHTWIVLLVAFLTMCKYMMTSSNGNIFRVTGHLCGEFIGPRWIPNTKAMQWRGALMFSFICVWINGWVNNREAGDLRRKRAHYDFVVMI